MFDVHTTFLSVWYWVALAGFWSAATHFTHGVPYGAMWRAARHGGEDAALCDALARSGLARIAEATRQWGAVVAAAGGFGLAALAMAGLVAGMEPALGLLVMAAPAAAMAVAGLVEALELAEAPPPPAELLGRLFRRRRLNQLFATGGVLLAAAAMASLHWDRLAFLGGATRL